MDLGFRLAAQVRRLLLDQAKPALTLVNGRLAIEDLELVERGHLDWQEVRYESIDGAAMRGRIKHLRHVQGYYAALDGPVPIVGFPFLRKPASHNSNAEMLQLSRKIRDFLEN
jgi:hypothetical protein